MLIDTTVWIDFFANKPTHQTIYLEQLISDREDIYLCGIILTEILQGIKNSKEYHQIEKSLRPILFVDMTQSTFILAANIYRKLRTQGVTIRKTADCMIAAVAIENGLTLLHNDKDFNPIEKYCGLHTKKNN